MATLAHAASGHVRPLPARTLVGRTTSCALRLDDPRVSGEHAVLQWTRSGWEARDLGSRNGTFVDGRRLQPGEAVALGAGARLAFGHEDNLWILAEDGAPAAIAERTDGGGTRAAADRILALPSDAEPRVAIYADPRGRWVVEESEREPRAVKDGEILAIDGVSWRIHLPAAVEGTATVDSGPSLETVKLRFGVSRDEEHVQLTVVYRGKEVPLEPREHAYTLLTLARARLDDRDEPSAEQGWVERDRLLKMLHIDSNGLNVAIYRARGQLSAAGVEGAAGIVEVRRGQRRIGLEPSQLEVTAL